MAPYEAESEWAFNVLAGAATVYAGKFLLLKRSGHESFLPNVWGIPAGQIMFDEDPQAAALRELSEETGLRGQVMSLIGYSTFMSRRGSSPLSNVQLNFLIQAASDKVTLNQSSHSTHSWIPLVDEDSELLDGFTRDIMKSARSYYRESPQFGWSP